MTWKSAMYNLFQELLDGKPGGSDQALERRHVPQSSITVWLEEIGLGQFA
jgi:hypothetical protein